MTANLLYLSRLVMLDSAICTAEVKYIQDEASDDVCSSF